MKNSVKLKNTICAMNAFREEKPSIKGITASDLIFSKIKTGSSASFCTGYVGALLIFE